MIARKMININERWVTDIDKEELLTDRWLKDKWVFR